MQMAPGWKPPERRVPEVKLPDSGVPKVKLPDSRYKDYLVSDIGAFLGGVGMLILVLWLVCGIVALFFGQDGGEWGWGFGFAWYLTLLAAAAAGMAGVGIFVSIRIWLRH